MKLFETNFSKEKPELIAAPVLLSTFKFQLIIKSHYCGEGNNDFEIIYLNDLRYPAACASASELK